MQHHVTDYIDRLPVWQAAMARELRDAIHAADPDIKETLKWGAPAFEHAGLVAWMFSASEWLHFSFPQGRLLDHQHGLFEEKLDDAHSKAKRTIKFKKGDTVPADVITALVRQAVANNLSGNKVVFTRKAPREIVVPRDVAIELKSAGLAEAYQSRPYYQRKGYLQWLEVAKRPETRLRRLHTMLDELRQGTYMPPRRTVK